jgi:hypothetical protein
MVGYSLLMNRHKWCIVHISDAQKGRHYTRPPQARLDALLPEQGRKREKTGGVAYGLR